MTILSSPSSSDRSAEPTSPAAAPGLSSSLRQALAHPLASFWLVVVSAGLLLALGTMMVLSASSVVGQVEYDDPYYYVKRQIVFLVAGLGALWFLAYRPPRHLRVLAWVSWFVSVGLLLLLFTPLAVSAGGNTNWVAIPGLDFFNIQPSELAKLSIVLWGADVLDRKEKLLDQPRHLLVPYVPMVGVLVGLTLVGRDLGTAVVMGVIILAVLWMVGTPLRLLALLGLLAAGGAAALVLTSENRVNRFLSFLNPVQDTDGIGMQPTLGVWALASGGWWGVGLGASRQKFGGLVEAHTDFVFAIIGEELGLVGTLTVLTLFLVLGYAGLRIALRSDTTFCRMLAAGITAWFMGQALINLAVVLRLAPVMGVPLPFVSYGGAAMLVNLAALGLLLACAREEPQARRLLRRRSSSPRPRMTAVV
uniref:putative lipid II flippase FtsW n=1 Tax=Desertihabitans aurantiacus TaxID=2282477 RepID=UPI0018E56D62